MPKVSPSPRPLVTRIYILVCPDTGAVRYVGKTTQDLRARLSSHLAASNRTHCARWIRSLKEHGKKPAMELLSIASGNGNAEEQYWIAEMRRRGEPLTNLTDGGEGFAGLVFTPEHKARIGNANRHPRGPSEERPCARCGVMLRIVPWKLRRTESGLFFCSASHRNQYLAPIRKWHRLVPGEEKKSALPAAGHLLPALASSSIARQPVGMLPTGGVWLAAPPSSWSDQGCMGA